MCFVAVAIGVSPSKGGLPVINSYSTVPKEYRSDSFDTGFP